MNTFVYVLSALRIRARFAAWDAEVKFGLEFRSVPDNRACDCGAILRGVKTPVDCKLFGTVCTPENPMGSCMVSSANQNPSLTYMALTARACAYAVDALNRRHFGKLMARMKSDPDSVERAVSLLSVSRNVERIADLATNVAEDVVFLVEALDIRHPGLVGT